MPRRCIAVCGAIVLAMSAAVAAQRRPPNVDLQPLVAPGLPINLQYPKKDWRVVPGAGATLLTIVQKNDEALVAVELARLKLALAPEDVSDIFAEHEVGLVRELHPGVSELQWKLVDEAGRRIVVLNYVKKGLRGPERVRQYAYPIGTTLYRVICASPVAQFATYEPVFAQISGSLKVPTS